MIATWKIRTDYANALDIFDKISPWFRESGAQMTAVMHNIGGGALKGLSPDMGSPLAPPSSPLPSGPSIPF